MFRHLFTLIWNKKGQHVLLIIEMVVSFFVLFAVFTLMAFCFNNYRKPMGLTDRDVWIATYNNTMETNDSDSLLTFYETLRRTVATLPHVEGVSYMTSNAPFANSTIQTGTQYRDIKVTGVDIYRTDMHLAKVLGMVVTEGRWFDNTDKASTTQGVVINETLRERLFGNKNAVGEFIGEDYKSEGNKGRGPRVLGVVKDAKFKGDYSTVSPAMFVRADSTDYKWLGSMIVKVAPGSGIAQEGRLYNTLSRTMKGSNIDVQHLTAQRSSINNLALVPLIVSSIVAGFLIINVALGLFGVLWYTINKRRGEIGLRRAIGATGSSVSGQLVAESLILSTFAILIGLFFAMQFPLLHVFDLATGIYLTAILLSVVSVYVLVFLCAIYPGRQAAAIYPAVALHED
ncbi:ABC transporter permease [Chitinophaga pendula]|uniref:ABC transporter permease n=1 Tax=Chitinophaga TaxID=79328 RepID=UPI000BB0469F|nr:MULTISPECIES: ABC transporter permease [Chitinophaga]ASZ11912.1 ABC transporter permease [Chitinophaga sp. MD30]UCJ05060.1 ABC transporter permease [Chitinophaga pendula]